MSVATIFGQREVKDELGLETELTDKCVVNEGEM